MSALELLPDAENLLAEMDLLSHKYTVFIEALSARYKISAEVECHDPNVHALRFCKRASVWTLLALAREGADWQDVLSSSMATRIAAAHHLRALAAACVEAWRSTARAAQEAGEEIDAVTQELVGTRRSAEAPWP